MERKAEPERNMWFWGERKFLFFEAGTHTDRFFPEFKGLDAWFLGAGCRVPLTPLTTPFHNAELTVARLFIAFLNVAVLIITVFTLY